MTLQCLLLHAEAQNPSNHPSMQSMPKDGIVWGCVEMTPDIRHVSMLQSHLLHAEAVEISAT